ncbi:hypothetical protein M0802_015088 [Mischocyttarus mexicanus]|nr:hypothetical protein M0802_015088 [Mischocyttarus mexicanus]
MRRIRPREVAHHARNVPLVHKESQQAAHVVLRDDTIRQPLQPPYRCPYEILARVNQKHYTVLVKEKPCNISIKRLKPAFLDVTEFQQDTAQTPQVPELRTYPGAKAKQRVNF